MNVTPRRRYSVQHDPHDDTWWVIEDGNNITGLQFLEQAWAHSAADALNGGLGRGVYAYDALPDHLTGT